MDISNTAYKDILNDKQWEAVQYNDGVSIIVAGAGSGKTRVLTYKIAYLLEQGWRPSTILALTFTNKAAREMKERIAKVVGEDKAKWLWMGTFHSVFYRILRTEAHRIGFTPLFTIYDASDSKSLVKSLIKELQLDDKIYKYNSVLARISNAKNNLITPAVYTTKTDLIQSDIHSKMPKFSDIYALYCRRCKDSNAMDFDDLLLYTNILFRDCPDVLENYQNRFSYILVDEYQDTNIAQHIIVNKLAEKCGHICIVGDDAQSIYSFRGANIDNMLSFQKTHENCRLFRLEQNYRSTQTIVKAANSLISKNKNRIHKEVFSKLAVGERIKVTGCYSDFDEGFNVANKIYNLVAEKSIHYSDIAVLYRTNAQSRILEESLRKRNLPYKIYGGLSFYQRKEIKDILAYLRLLVNPDDEESLKRIINYPARGIGDTTQQKIFAAAHAQNTSALTIMDNPMEFALEVNKGTTEKLMRFGELMHSLQEFSQEHDAYSVTEKVILDAGIMKDVSTDSSPENISRKENIQELMNAIHEFCDSHVNEGSLDINLTNFLSEVSLSTDQDNDKTDQTARITLMTAHAAKGLEFAYIFIVGMEENLFPSIMCESERELEEERRLFYVAITRAKLACYITYAKSRFRNGQTQFSNPSRFLYDIDDAYLDFPESRKNSEQKTVQKETFPFLSQRQSNPKPIRNLKPVQNSSSSETQKSYGLKIGDNITHTTFGNGKVLNIEGNGDNTKALINFENYGSKQLLLKYARLTIIN